MKSFFIFLLLVYQVVDGSQRPMDAMADLTNDLGVCILQILATMQEGNVVFSPYGIASVSVLLFEGATGNTALEILRVLNLPWNTLLARIGFRDMNRHLKTYFKSDGFLRGLIMSKDEVCFHASYQKILRLYGFEEPDHALTYPCHGFIPYSPATIPLPSSTTEVVTTAFSSEAPAAGEGTTSSPGESTPASTEISTITDENIVTELTQTSQTVMLFNTTTFKTSNPIEEEALRESNRPTTEIISGDTTQLRTEVTFPQETFTLSETLTSTNLLNSPNLTTSQTSNVSIKEKLNEPLMTEVTETSTKSEIVTLSQNKIEPSGSETILVPIFSSPSNIPVDYTSSESAPESMKIKVERINSSRSLKPKLPSVPKISREILKKEMKGILNRYKHRNITNINDIIAEIENDLKFNSSAKNSSFPDELLDDLLASTRTVENSTEDITTFDEFDELNYFFNNFTTKKDFISSTEIFKHLINDTTFKPFNDSFKKFKEYDFNQSFDFSTEKFDHDISLELIPFNDTSFFNSSTEINLNETSTLYDTLLGFIDNTTQSIRDFIGLTSSTVAPISSFDTAISTTSKPYSSSVNATEKYDQNRTTSMNSLENQVTGVPPLNSKNLNKSELNNEMSNHILPKKSISGQNENIISLPEHRDQKLPNYVNVLSLKQSKLTSTKFNIKGINPEIIQKRSKLTKSTKSRVDESPIDLLKLTEQPIISSKLQTSRPNCDISLAESLNNSLCDVRNSSNITENDNQVVTGKRKIRSFEHDNFKNFHAFDLPQSDMDWFALYDNRNMIRVPVFTYSAYLPYAYVEELKSKVLEVPLDDSQYSLILILPSHRYGLNYLLSSLSNWSIRKIHRQLRPVSVYAIIPKFRVVSHVDLKPALYALGIRDVFYRYRADLSVMSPDARLFVRSIEQVVTVHVDKYPSAVYEVPEKYTERYFSVSHPFVYFVIDKESKVSLVAGIMADPSKQHTHPL